MFSRMEIVVVDDEMVMRQMLQRALSRAGYSASACASGLEALQLLEKRGGEALLVLDYAMPGLNGAEVCRSVRSHADAAIAQTPIILLTAHTGEAHEIECFQAGADDFVSKPVNLPVLKARIETHLRLAALRTRLREQNRLLEEWRAMSEVDLEAAGLIQEAIIPRQLPELPGWKSALHCQPLIQVGGDSFDGVPLPGGGLLVWIADATGHGVSAALVTVLIKLLFRHAVEECGEPARIIERVNREFLAIFKGHSFLTAACVLLQQGEGRIRAAGAGHPPLIILREGGRGEALASSAPPVGLLAAAALEEREATLNPGDALLLVTDGIYGVSNPHGQRFSFVQLLHSLEGFHMERPEDWITAALGQAHAFAQGEPFDDDVALVALLRN